MKKLFSLLAMAAMVFTACQNDEGVKNPTLADEGIVNLSVGVPELATRALDGDNQFGADSAYGAIDYANYTKFLEEDYDVRFQMAVYEAGAAEDAEPIYTATNYVDFASTTNFNDLRFVPGREYQFVIFADFVEQGTQVDFRYNTADLRNITTVGNSKLNAMDETFDAYFFNETIKVEAGKVNELQATLKRPFGKIRVLTTDLEWVENYAVPAEGTVTFYNHAIYKSFNALTGEVSTEATNDEESLTYAINQEYYGATKYEGKNAATLFATYILGNEWQEAVNFRLDTFEEDGSLIKSLDFNTEIPYQRNHLTTLVGNLLTNEADLFVRIDDNFDAETFVKGDFDNLESGLGYVREGVLEAYDVYRYETNLFDFLLLSDEGGNVLPVGEFPFGKESIMIQNGYAFGIDGIDVEKGTLTIEKRNTRAAGDSYYVVFDIYATINGVTENYILTWNGELKAPRTPLAEPVVTYEVDEVEALYITFSWEAVEGAKNYTVEWNGEKQTVEGTSVTFDFAGVDTKATAYVTANPEFTWSNTASTGSVLVDWKAPITYTEVEVFLQYIDGTEVAFYTEGLTIYFKEYPSFDGAWYQATGELPKVFSADATVEETAGNAAKVVITDPAIATKFIYNGALGKPYVLTAADVKWTDGANTVAVAFSNEAGDAITIHTSVPLTEGRYEITPSYVAIGGDTAPKIEKTEMNVLLDNGEYTVFFTVHSVLNDILMVYTGAIDFTKPYTPEYKLTSYEARENTIYFEGEGVKYEIEATSLESGDVVVKYIAIENNSMEITAATAVVKEENGEYDARYTLPLGYTNPFTGKDTFDLQYVGPFKPYEAPVEPEKPIEFTATYEALTQGAYLFTGKEYTFTIYVEKLETTEYVTGETYDAWAYGPFEANQPKSNFKTGDKLTVENNVVTLEFTAAPMSEEYRYKMTCDMNPATQEPEDIRLEATVDGTVYTAGDYMIEYYQGYATAYYQKNLMRGVTVEVADSADDIEFTFFHAERNANIHIIYNKNVVTPATDLKIELQFNGTIYTYTFENGYKYVFDTIEGKVGYVAPNGWAPEATFEYTLVESATVDTYTFQDTLNNYNVTATYKKGETLVADLELKSWKHGADVGDNGIKFNAYVDANNINDNYVEVVVNTTDATNNSIAEGTYTHTTGWPYEMKNIFALSAYKLNGVRVTKSNIPEGQMIVVKNGENYDITIVAGEFVAHYFGTVGEATVTPEPDQPGTDEPVDEWTNLTEVAQKTTVYGREAYATDNYTLASGYWYFAGGFVEGGQYTTETTATGYIFTFDDETNKRHVTITYSEFTENDPWVFSAEVTDKSGFYVQVTLTGDNGDVIVVDNLAQGSPMAPGTVKINGTETAVKGTVQIDNSSKVVVDLTSDVASYKGTSTNALF